MFKIISLSVIAAALIGCSSGPKVKAQTEQFCDLKTKTVVVKNGDDTLAENTVEVMECNDNRIKRLFQVQSGMAPNCGEFVYWMKQGGQDVQRKGVSCQKPNGSWEIVNTVGR